MEATNSKIAVALFGAPGSGKGTQADRLAEKHGLVHIDTGKIIERTVHDPARKDDPIIQRERKNFDTGILTTPEWFVHELLLPEVKRHALAGQGIVFSGSPRTLFEAETLVPYLADLYGSDHFLLFRINVSPETSIFRNIHRRVCKDCRTPIIYTQETAGLTHCPLCGGELVTRTLDTEEAMKVRLDEYRNRTEPIFDLLRQKGFSIIEIDGEPMPDVVTLEIDEKLKKGFVV